MLIDGLKAKINITKSNVIFEPAVVTNYSSGDRQLDFAIVSYLKGESNYNECLCRIIEQIACRPECQIKDNICIIDLLSDILDNATWMSQRDPYKSRDYDPEYPVRWLGCIAAAHHDYSGYNTTSYNDMKCMIERREYGPAEALKMIQQHWDQLCIRKSGYEALEYVLRCSDNYTEPVYINSAIRDIGYMLGPLWNDERKNKRL